MTKSVVQQAAMVLLLFAVAACQSGDQPEVEAPRFRADGILAFHSSADTVITRIAIEIAETDEAQRRGLMGRTGLPARGGMLFPYQEPRMMEFWMKNTPLPLDIIFVAADSTIVNIVKNTTPLSEELIASTGPAQYTLEVRAGFADRYGIDESTRIDWSRETAPTN